MKKLFIALMMTGVLVSVDASAAIRKACPAGTYSKAGAKSLADCIRCSTLGPDKYSAKEASATCATCPNGKIADETATKCLDACAANQLLSDGRCRNCPTGYVCNGTAGFECLEGYYMKVSGASKSCAKCGANMKTCTGTEEFTCNDGFFRNGKSCTACPKNSKTCTQERFVCQDGFYENGTACTACPAGYYCSTVEDGPEV